MSWALRGSLLMALISLGSLSLGAGGSGAAAAAAGRSRPVPVIGIRAGQTGPRSAVPWRHVGPGWVLVEYWPGRQGFEANPKAAAAVLYIVDPAGGRYRLFRWPVMKNPPFLADWSGDKTRALISTSSGVFEQLVLASGKISRFRLPARADVLGYTRPRGRELLGWSEHRKSTQLARYRLTGRLDKVLIAHALNVEAVYAGNGRMLAVSASQGIRLIGRNGGILRMLPVPGVTEGCQPARWWRPSVVLATCQVAKTRYHTLWLVPADGSRPVRLTSRPGKDGREFFQLDAWRVHGTLYVQAMTNSGAGHILRQDPSGQLVRLTVPHAARSNWIATAQGSRLLVIASPLRGEGSSSLRWLDPATRHEQVLIRSRHGLTGFAGAIPFGQPVATMSTVAGG